MAAVPRPPQRTGGEPEQEELVWKAVSDLVISIEHLEQEYEAVRLEKKLRDYFKKAAKNLEFWRKPWADVVSDYADAVYEMLFQGLGGRPWLMQGEADFLLVLDAGIKEHFPPALLTSVPRGAFERTVLTANDRAFEEQRYLPLLWETIQSILQGPKIRKKSYDAFEEGRKNAAGCTGDEAGSPIATFLQAWIHNTIARLAADSGGMPDSIVDPQQCAYLFHALIGQGALPLPLVAEQGVPPPGWPFVDQVVGQAYAQAGCGVPPFMKGGCKGKGKGKAGAGCGGKAFGGKAGGKAAFGAGSGASNGAGAKRAANGAAAAGGGADAKRQRGDGGGKGKGAGVTKGNPHCIQQEDCVGTSATDLVQHVDGDVAGDVYCSACWAVFADADPSLTAMPYETPS